MKVHISSFRKDFLRHRRPQKVVQLTLTSNVLKIVNTRSRKETETQFSLNNYLDALKTAEMSVGCSSL